MSKTRPASHSEPLPVPAGAAPIKGNLFCSFAEAAARVPAKSCLEDGPQVCTYGSMLDRSAAVAALLRSCGLKKGDRVLAQIAKTPTAVMLYLGCLRAGVVFVPLNTAYTASELIYFLTDAQPAMLVCSKEMAEALSDCNDEIGAIQLTLEEDETGSFADQLRNSTTEGEITSVGTDETAAILYTSGTTGKPKGAMLTHGNLLANVSALNEAWQWQDDDVLLHVLPIFHAHGLFVALHCALFRASTIVFHRRFDPSLVCSDLSRISVFMGVPTVYGRLLNQDEFSSRLCSSVRLFISGSAPLGSEAFKRFEERTGHRILERYGMTETLMITSNPVEGERVAGSVGYALPGMSIRLDDDDNGTAPLEVEGPSVFKGYWNNPEKTRDSFTSDGFFKTGDIAKIDPDGRVYLVGRNSDLIISGGFNVYPKEIETALEELPGIDEAAVIGVPHPDFGEAVLGLVVMRGDSLFDATGIEGALRSKVAGFKCPKRVIAVSELPKNAMGKVLKTELRSSYSELFAATS